MLSPTAPDQLALLHTTSISELRPVESGALLLLSLHETHTTEAIHTKINVMNLIGTVCLLKSAVYIYAVLYFLTTLCREMSNG